jgi:hypothetical protein
MGTRPKKNKNWKPLKGKIMNKLLTVWQVWNRTIINCRLECDKHENVRANRVETAQENNEKIRVTSDVFKVKRCGSSLLASNRKNEI